MKDVIITLIYQGWWAFSFFLSKIYIPLGNLAFILYFAVLKFFPILFHLICPTRRGDRMPRNVKEVTVSMCWPYYSLFRYALFDKTMVPTVPTCPILFIYGKHKNVMFHNYLGYDHIILQIACESVTAKRRLHRGDRLRHLRNDNASDNASRGR